jgi:predicted dehydrogenase
MSTEEALGSPATTATAATPGKQAAATGERPARRDAPALRVGLVGCGKISEAYLRPEYPEVAYVACADLDETRAKATAASHGLRAMPVDDLLADPEIDVVCNLTVPRAHAAVSRAALQAGKHVYSEKPLALDREEGKALLDLAEASGLAVGCAPDTFLGAGLQTCRRLVDDGKLGVPVAAMAHMVNHGPENWHPDPAFYFLRGGGPLFDMGPYYLTALVSLVGPVSRVIAGARGTSAERVVRRGARAGQVLSVEVPTHVAAVLELAGGTMATLVTSFEVWQSSVPKLELHGTEGSLVLPDPNTFGGPARFFPAGSEEWEDVPVDGFELHGRGIGLASLGSALRGTGENRASGRLAYHVLDAMVAIVESAEAGRRVEVSSSAERPAPMPAHWT